MLDHQGSHYKIKLTEILAVKNNKKMIKEMFICLKMKQHRFK